MRVWSFGAQPSVPGFLAPRVVSGVYPHGGICPRFVFTAYDPGHLDGPCCAASVDGHLRSPPTSVAAVSEAVKGTAC